MEYAGTKIAFDYYLSTVFHSQPALQALYSQIFEASEIPSESLLSCLWCTFEFRRTNANSRSLTRMFMRQASVY